MFLSAWWTASYSFKATTAWGILRYLHSGHMGRTLPNSYSSHCEPSALWTQPWNYTSLLDIPFVLGRLIASQVPWNHNILRHPRRCLVLRPSGKMKKQPEDMLGVSLHTTKLRNENHSLKHPGCSAACRRTTPTDLKPPWSYDAHSETEITVCS